MFGKSVQLFKTRIGSYKVNYCLEKKKKKLFRGSYTEKDSRNCRNWNIPRWFIINSRAYQWRQSQRDKVREMQTLLNVLLHWQSHQFFVLLGCAILYNRKGNVLQKQTLGFHLWLPFYCQIDSFSWLQNVHDIKKLWQERVWEPVPSLYHDIMLSNVHYQNTSLRSGRVV